MEDFIYQQMSRIENSHWWFISWRNVINIFLKKNLAKCEKNIILDVGCGTGYLSNMLNNFGKTIGIDVNEQALNFCQNKKYYKLHKATAEDLPFEDNTFDGVVCAGVLYHNMVKDDKKALKEMFRVCKKGATLILLEPAFEWLGGSPHDIVEHTSRRYTLNELCDKVKNSGFKIKKASYRVFFLFPIIAAVKLFKRIFSLSEQPQSDLYPLPVFINKFLALLMEIENRLLYFVNLPIGNNIICVATKQ